MNLKTARWTAKLFFNGMAVGLSVIGAGLAPAAEAPAGRQAAEDVNSPEIRERTGIQPNTNMLFNGWGVTPAGKQVTVSDLALKMVIAPDGKRAMATHGGFNEHGVTVLDLASQKVTQFLPLPEAWNGLAFSPNGRHFYVSGGDSGMIHVFAYTNGVAGLESSIRPGPKGGNVFLAGLTVDPQDGDIYVCNEANNEIWVLDEALLQIQKRIPVGEHPHSCLLGGDKLHLYVSNWGGRSVSIVDTKQGRRVRDIGVGVRPNDMALAPDGRLFVACSGDNTVHVIQTKVLENQEAAASPSRRIPEGTREIIETALYPLLPHGKMTPRGGG